MKKINVALIIVSLGVAIFGLAILPKVPYLVSNQLASPPNLAEAENVILYRSNKALNISKDLVYLFEKGGSNEMFASLTGKRGKELTTHGINLYLFKGDSLVFWTDNNYVSSIERSAKAALVFLNNAWSIALWIDFNQLDVLALIKIKDQYPIQNKFLKNQYHQSLLFLNDFNLVPYFTEGAFPLRVFGGTPLMYFAHNSRDFEIECKVYRSYISWAIYLSLLIFVYVLFWASFFTRRGLLSSFILFLILLGSRSALLYWQVLPGLPLPLFSAEIYAHSWLYPSLGDFMVNAILVFLVVLYAYNNVSVVLAKMKQAMEWIAALLLGSVVLLTLLYTDNLFESLILNSTVNLETHRIFNLSLYSLVEYLSISLWFASAIMLVHWVVKLLWRQNSKVVIVSFLIALLLIVGLRFVIFNEFSSYGLAFVLAVVVVVGFYSWRMRRMSHRVFILLIGFFSIYSVLTVSQNAEQKDKAIRKVMAVNLGNERDPIAEVMFPSLARKLQFDKEILMALEDFSASLPSLYSYLSDNYLNGYFKKYDFQITACMPTSQLSIEKSSELVGCYSFFEEMLNEFGFRIPGSNFYHLNNQNGRISYLGILEYTLDDGEETTLYLELDTKLSRELLGYPELLLENKSSAKENFRDYSTAKYSGGHLIARTGSFNYPIRSVFPSDSLSRYSAFNDGGYNHLVYRSEGDITLVVSRPNVSLFNITASFAWMFLFFYLTLFTWLRLARFPIRAKLSSSNFSNRIRKTMVLVLLLSMVLVGLVTIAYNIQSFEKKSRENLTEKLLSVMVDVEKNLVAENWLSAEYTDYLTYYMIYLSNIFYSDINLFDAEGNLLASSRPEIIERKLLGPRIDPVAWYELVYKHQSRLVQTERIGNMNYTSAYVPLSNAGGQVVGYLNLPYFTRQNEFIREVFSVLVALINIYALLILFTLFVAIIISNQITRPLEFIRIKLRKIDIGKHNEPILYSSNDEVGLLVKEYNRMVAELAESAEKLAQSQRQSAWREMAKQIAHEIKNPLTPMKLSIQHLIKAKKENQPNWEQLFDKFSGSLIQQINTLSNIATEFSNFAKMPISKPEPIAIQLLVDESVSLFSSYRNLKIVFTCTVTDGVKVFVDKEQLQRVFVNLLKNAIQAIPKGQKGLIEVCAQETKDKVVVKISDNGMGMDEEAKRRIFSPNFTTKSGGMGLGLAMSREIVETNGGKIWFESQQNVGTTFFVELPVASLGHD